MKRKPLLIELLELATAEELRYVRSLSEAERNAAGSAESWSPKDRLAHIAAWKLRSAEDVQQALDGSPPVREADFDFDAENARLHAGHARMSWDEVLVLAQKARKVMMSVVDRLDEDQLASSDILPRPGSPPLWRVIVGNGFSHPLVHLSEYYRENGDLMRASEVIGRMARRAISLDDGPVWQGTVRYNLACHYALLGEKTRAIHELRGALALNPALAEWSRSDPDLESLHGEEDYERIVRA